MRAIYKYPLRAFFNRVPIHEDGKLLHVAYDGAEHCLCVWAEIDTDHPICDRKIQLVGTGHEVLSGGVYIGTAKDGPFVWHVYDLGEWCDT
jgi:hypothetical protein